MIESEDRTTHRAKRVKSTTDKYASIRSERDFSAPKSAETRLYEKIFGESEPAPQQKSKFGKGQLGAYSWNKDFTA